MRLDGRVTVWIAGADRVAAVTAIADAFGARGHSKLVILDGPAGSGLTFVLEQAYRVFAAAEHDTGGVIGRPKSGRAILSRKVSFLRRSPHSSGCG
jgi:hypothetical protein